MIWSYTHLSPYKQWALFNRSPRYVINNTRSPTEQLFFSSLTPRPKPFRTSCVMWRSYLTVLCNRHPISANAGHLCKICYLATKRIHRTRVHRSQENKMFWLKFIHYIIYNQDSGFHALKKVNVNTTFFLSRIHFVVFI